MDHSTSLDAGGEMSLPLRRIETLSVKATARYNPTRKFLSTKLLRRRRPALQVARLSIDFAAGHAFDTAEHFAAKDSQPPLCRWRTRLLSVAP
jgi:hypothetical protein